jgi:Carboxypeptidase regulatory-like domain/TonB dependent receptor-like, beta-barrel/TonB-dependent Receptor Plug Domain
MRTPAESSRLLRQGVQVGLLLAVMAFATPAWCQIDTGTILGTISDPSGAVIPKAKVSLINEGTNLTITTTANADGSYVFSPVKIGTYSVAAEAPGFAKGLRTHLTLNINEDLVANISLKPGAVTQTVEVTAAPPALQSENASVGQVVGARTVNELPLNGRNFTFLAQTVAGVNTPQADTRGNAASGAFSANGLRPAQNNYLLNGIDNNSDNVDFLNGTNFVVLPPPDALSEFKVQTSDYSAQYGRAGGAILNAIVKSGTNQLHGDVWEFFRNDKLDAADFFEDQGGIQKGEYRQNQFGGTVGGPIVIPHVYNGRDKLFFFGDVEILRRRQGSVFTNSVPTALERSSGFQNLADVLLNSSGSNTDDLGRTIPNGTVSDPGTMRRVTAGQVDPVTGLVATNSGYVADPFYTGGAVGKMTNFTGLCPSETACQLNQIPGDRIDPNAVKLLDLYPAPQLSGTVNNQTSNPVLDENREAFDTRIDWDKSERDQVFGTFSYVNDPQFIPAPFSGIADGGAFQQGDQTAKSFLGALSYTHTFNPTTVNELRVGEDRLHTSRFGPVGTQLNIPEQYGIQGIAQVTENGGLPAIGISGLNTLGSNAFLPSDEITQTTQLTENLTKVYSKHTFKAGMEFQHIKFSTLQPAWSHGQLNYDGNYTGVGMAQVLVSPIASTVPNGVNFDGGADTVFVSNFSPTDDGHNYWAGYLQDDWKVSPKLTLNLGLRWEHFGAIEENHGRQGNFVPGTPNGTAEMLYPSNGKNQALMQAAPQWPAILAKDGIALKFIGNPALSNVQNTNFGPRLGVAYQVTPKLVVRSGFGMFYNAFENAGYGPNIGENFPFQFTINPPAPNGSSPIPLNNADGSNCSPAATLENTFSCISLDPALVNVNGLGPQGLQYDFKTPYTLGWNLTVEYALTPNTTLTVAYVGDGSRHLITGNGASNSPSIIETNPLATVCGPGGITPFPDIGCNNSIQLTQGNSNYNSLQTTFEKRYSSGLNFLATYTWSHCRGDAGDELNGGIGEGARAPGLPGFGIQGDYQNCDYNIFNVFHFSGGYQLPFGSKKRFLGNATGVANQLIGGWQTVWNFTAEGGQPMTIGCPYGTNGDFGCHSMLIPGMDPYGSGAPDHYLNAAAFTQPCPAPGFTQPPRCSNVGTGIGLLGGAPTMISGPGITRLDFSLFKAFQLTERYRLEFRSEFFNILNHPTFNAPGFGGNGVVSVPGSTNFFDPHFGAIGSTRFPFQDPRQIQFALKLYF